MLCDKESMSDGDHDPQPLGQVTGVDEKVGVSVGRYPWDIMKELMTLPWRLQLRALDLWRGQTMANMRAFSRLNGMEQSLEEQSYRNGLDLVELIPLIENFVNALPEPQRTIMRKGIMTEEDFLKASHDENTLNASEQLLEWYVKASGRKGQLSQPPYNHEMLAEKMDGSIEPVDPERIISLFQPTPQNGMKKPERYPRIIFTSSHANGSSLKDVTKITHGIEALARDSFGEKLNITTIDNDPQPGETMILFACESREHPVLNGIDLTRRLNEITRANESGKPDEFWRASDGAKRTAKLMLACMCENYYDENGKPAFNVDDPRPLSELFENGEHKLRLSADARRVAQHFQLMGYSKGGNVVSDAVRYLERELSAVDVNDRGIVRTPKEWPVDRGILREEKYGVRSIMNNINVACIAARDLPFTQEQKDRGLRRVAFTNRHDPLTRNYRYKSTYNDELYETEGSVEDGHNPELALGTREKRGYFLDDENVNRRMKEFFAAHYGKAAIANLFVEDGQVKIEAAPSTPDAMVEAHAEVIIGALEEAGLHNVRLVGNDYHIGTFAIEADEDLTRDRDAIQKLGAGFKTLREQAPGLVIAQKIIREDVPSLSKKARDQVVGKYSRTEYEANLQGPTKPPQNGRAA